MSASPTHREYQSPLQQLAQASRQKDKLLHQAANNASTQPPDDNPFAAAIAHNKAKRKHKVKLLAKMKAHQATTTSVTTQEEDKLIDNREESECAETPAGTNDMDVDTISASKTHTADHDNGGAPEQHHKKVTISEPNKLVFNEVKTKFK